MNANIVTLPGDGIGPEVTAQAVRILTAVADLFGHRFQFESAPIGGAAIDATGSALPDSTLHACRSASAVLLGAVGGPQWDGAEATVRPEQGLLALRKGLGVYANLRPVRVPDCLADRSTLRPEVVRGVDLVVVRELTGGMYFGDKSRGPGEGGEEAIDVCRYSTAEIERVARRAGQLARGRRGRLASVDKANVLETSRLWRETVTRVMAEEFADLTVEHVLVDACAMHLIRNPGAFDVILTENLFGDILTDEAAMLAGSIGLLPSASLGAPGTPGLFEPIHGSAPTIAGRDLANPYGAILSAAMLLRQGLSLGTEADAVEQVVEQAWSAGLLPADLADASTTPYGTEAIGAAVAALLTDAAMPATATR
ncbi:MAG: 3-isopropylmalate dehydrogenase [Gemmatimonadales bacterium]|nr:3-isopropylmalate dehydrogenase [Gemmatimonadales bacterium]